MKTIATKREINNTFRVKIQVGYCDLQTLLSCEQAAYYTANAYGWRADIYEFGGNAIVTGYEPFGNIVAERALCEKYEHLAREIKRKNPIDYQTQKAELRKLIDKFVNEVLGEAAPDKEVS